MPAYYVLINEKNQWSSAHYTSDRSSCAGVMLSFLHAGRGSSAGAVHVVVQVQEVAVQVTIPVQEVVQVGL